MYSGDFEAKMRAREQFSDDAVSEDYHIVIRLDGVGFTKYTQRQGFAKPFDEGFSARMVACLKTLLARFEGVYATTHSDEMSVYVHPRSELYGRRAEKLATVAAGIVSAQFGEAFDARVWVGDTQEDVIDYFSWRQADAVTGGLSSWTYWSLRKSGLSSAQATSRLLGVGDARKHEILESLGVKWESTPTWTRRGIDVSWRHVEKAGHNPLTDTTVMVERRQIDVSAEMLVRDDYREWLRLYLDEEVNR